MQITRRAVLRRLAGITAVASLVVSINFVVDDNVASFVAGRQASIQGLEHSGTAPGQLRRSTTTGADGPSVGSTTSMPQTSTSLADTTTSIPTSPSTTSPDSPTTIATTTTAAPAPTTTASPPPRTQDGKFTIMLRRSGDDLPSFWWNAPYLRTLPYTSGVGWTDGDRHAYTCAYMFLLQDGNVVGRVTFATVRDATYGKVNDQSMDERERWFDGTPNPSDTNMGDCGRANVDYEVSTADERPTINFMAGDDLLEVRNYKPTVVGEGITFDQVEVINQPFTEASPTGRVDTVYSRVTVVALEYGLPVVVVYYDSLDPSVTVISDLR